MIHETAIIDSKAKISRNVKIGPYTVIGPNVEIDEETEIQSHVNITGNTKIGKNNKIYPFASIVISLLYFDLASRQKALNVEKLEQFSNLIFGTSLSETKQSDKDDNEEIVEPEQVEVIEPEQSTADKDK